MVGIISVVIRGHFGGGDHFDGGDHFGGSTGPSPGSAFRPRENSELAHRNPIFVKPLFRVVRRPVHMNTGENKYTVSKISGFVWTGPKMESQ